MQDTQIIGDGGTPVPLPDRSSIDAIGDALTGVPTWVLVLGVAFVLAGLVVAARKLRKWGRVDTARKVTTFANGLGLLWSAQGMYDVATDPEHYSMPSQVASVLCILFEAFLLGRMLTAHRYRTDRVRRGKFVKAVWIGALVMALVVALGEGWSQAPARLAIPLLVAYSWYTDLTAEDDPDDKLETSWRWTPRELGLALGLLKRKVGDMKTPNEAERQDLLERVVRLGTRDRIGERWVGVVTRRRHRLARLMARADPELRAEARVKVAVAVKAFKEGILLEDEAPVAKATAAPRPAADRILKPPPTRAISGRIRVIAGGPDMPAGGVVTDIEADAIEMHRRSQRPDNPRGMKTAELMECYSPPLRQRMADSYAAAARKRINGHPVGEESKV